MKYTPYSLASYIDHHMIRALEINISKGCTDPITLYLQFSEVALLLGRERMTTSLLSDVQTELENTGLALKQEVKTFVLTLAGLRPRTSFVSLASLSEYK